MNKGGQHVVAPGVGPIARLKQENRDLKADLTRTLTEVDRLRREAFDYRDGFMEASAEVERLKDLIAADSVALGLHRELQTAAERIEGPGEWFHKDIRPAIAALHKAVRKVRRMDT